ncbi:MAG: YraN family protein [Dehalococcoidia bacterium]|jgi:putative endonuclease
MNRRETGTIAENIAADYLQKRGYKIRERNYRTREGEIDIIACKDDTLIFIEVRAKTGRTFGSAEESITERKKKRLVALAEAYLSDTGEQPESCRIDLIAIRIRADGGLTSINVIENATGWTTG